MGEIFLANMIGFLCGCILWYIDSKRQQKKIDKLSDLAVNLSSKLHDAQAKIKTLTQDNIHTKFPVKEIRITTSEFISGKADVFDIVGDFDIAIGDRFVCEIPISGYYHRTTGYKTQDNTYLLASNPVEEIPKLELHKAFVYKA
jgi:hypothetical protein